MSTPSDDHLPEPLQQQSLFAMLRDPIGIVVLVSTAMLLVVYYHGGDIPGLPDWAYRARLGWFGLNFVCLFIVPVLLNKFLLKRSMRDIGFVGGDWRVQLKFAALFGGVTIPAILIASRMGDFQGYYGQYMWGRHDIPLFVVFQFGWGVYFFAWEFFFRGFLLQVLGERFGTTAIALQTMPFVMMHFAKPELESVAAIIAGMALGWWAWRTRSFIGPWLLHWLCSATMILSVMFWQ
ncbi:MAG: CPBP family intramembrane metalloprotease [candidate division WS1 bacterium]|jgi:membrane protease YdiL (CAAX protease family)|nr:CPBP family intramembrane metalloprotease [candidate division WS1 bacterium]